MDDRRNGGGDDGDGDEWDTIWEEGNKWVKASGSLAGKTPPAGCLQCVHDGGYISMMYSEDHACVASGDRLLKNKRLQTAYVRALSALRL
jgi:hypothetical protein